MYVGLRRNTRRRNRNARKNSDVGTQRSGNTVLEENIPELVAKERRFEARQMLMKTGRADTLQSVLGKLESVEATADEQINADVEVVE